MVSAEETLWTLEFDGSCSNSGSGVGVVLISPSREIFPFSFKLDFHNTNNTAEYEALLLGLQEAKEKGIRQLKAKGDAELIVKQVRKQFSVKNDRLRHYRNLVWDEIESFEAFSIEFVPRAQNTKADSLAVSASLLLPHPEFKNNTYRIEVLYRPRVPDNINHWQVFNDDEQLKEFMACAGDFAKILFEGSEHGGKPIGEESTETGEVIQLQGNRIPKGLVSLEHLFGRKDDSTIKKDVGSNENKEEHDKINIGSEEDPKLISIGKTCSTREKKNLFELLIQYQDVFAWGYGDLKNFRNGEFVHHIPLKPRATTFRQKLRNYNPKVSEAIFREVEKMLKARIIYPIHHSTWVANIVPVRKKNGEIRICVDFRNLNQASLKDNYALPTMDHVLQSVAGSEVMSMLDGYSRYNQISVAPEDQHKTTFITP